MHLNILIIEFGDPVPVFFNVGGVYNYHVHVVLFNAINKQVIYNAALRIGQAAVLRFAGGELGCIVGSYALDEVKSIGSFQNELAHVAYIKNTGIVAYGCMFIVN